MKNLKDYLLSGSYHGRGIIAGQIGGCAAAAYFIMGRSQNSRNRVFKAEGENVVIYPFDRALVSDPSLIIYSPIKKLGNKVVVTNGDQTDTVCGFIRRSGDFAFERALETRTFEPDAPNFTPRISALLDFEKDFSYKMSIIKSDGKGGKCRRFTYSYEPEEGKIHFIHTYADGNPQKSFFGEPFETEWAGDIDGFAETVWQNLDGENKVSLAVKFFDLKTKKSQTRIINKNKL